MPRQPTKQPDINHITYAYSSSVLVVNTYETITLSFDSVAPGSRSKTLGVQLAAISTPIKNIKLGVINIGGLSWEEGIISYELLDFFDQGRYLSNTMPGINTSGSYGSVNNVAVGSISPYRSQVVHLNLNIGEQSRLTNTCLEFKWFFNF